LVSSTRRSLITTGRGALGSRHRAQIRRRFGFRGWSQSDDVDVLVEWLVAGPLADGLREPQLLPLAAGWCRERRVEPPAASTMSRNYHTLDASVDHSILSFFSPR
jgi:Domain of unknown function (DUF4158)